MNDGIGNSVNKVFVDCMSTICALSYPMEAGRANTAMISSLTSLSSFRTVFFTATTSRNEIESRGHFRLLKQMKVFV